MSIDPSGRIGWDSPDLTYQATSAHVLEVLTGAASNGYKAFLCDLGISYVIAGEEELDFEALLDKLAELLGVETLMLGSGGVLNWSFIQAGLCDEFSVVVAPVADGSSDTPALFESAGRTSDTPHGFRLEAAEPRAGGSVWLRHTVDNNQKD